MRGAHRERLVEKKRVEEGEMERGDDRGVREGMYLTKRGGMYLTKNIHLHRENIREKGSVRGR